MILVAYNRLLKMIYFVAITEVILAKILSRLFRDDVWKLYRLPESIVLNRGLQFVVELIKELNKMLEIEIKLLMLFYLQTDEQTKYMNQKLEQYLQFFVDNQQKNWPEQPIIAEFVVNNKIHLATKVFLFMMNYSRKLKIEVDIRRKGKMEKATEFAKRMKKI